MRNSLVAALVSCADQPLKQNTRRFLAGLSADELQFIAEFLGSCVLESEMHWAGNRGEIAERIALFQKMRADRAQRCSTDQAHKMILLLEYLCSAGVPQQPIGVRAAGSGAA